MYFLTHELENRLEASSDLTAGVRGLIEMESPTMLAEGTQLGRVLDDLDRQLQRGLRICLSRSTALQLLHDQYTVSPSSFQLRDVMRVVCGTRLEWKVAPDISTVQLDENLLLLVLESLVSNAFAHSGDAFPPHVSVRAAADELHFVVINAPGPQHAKLRSLKGNSIDALSPGDLVILKDPSGRGLAIASKCATLLNGRVELRFKEDSVEALLAIPFSSALIHNNASVSVPPDLLIISLDDDTTVRVRDTNAFALLGANAASCALGETAAQITDFVSLVLELPRPPDVILISQHLENPRTWAPLREGPDVVRELRKAGVKAKIAIRAASTSTAEVLSFRAAGADGVLPKALSLEAFSSHLVKLLNNNHKDGSSRSDRSFEQNTSESPSVSRTSLSVIDEEILRSFDPDFRKDTLQQLFDKGGSGGSSLHARVSAACEARRNGDKSVARRIIRMMQRSARSIGLLAIAKYADKALHEHCFSPVEMRRRIDETLDILHASRLFEADWLADDEVKQQLLARSSSSSSPRFTTAPAASRPRPPLRSSRARGPSNELSFTLKKSPPRPLIAVGLDDGVLPRDLLHCFFANKLEADIERSCVLGATEEEQKAFVAVACGRLDARLRPVPPAEQRAADIVVLDQNIDLVDRPHLYGTDIADELRANGFLGVICILSAASPGEMTSIRANPGVDVVFSKGGSFSVLNSELRCALAIRQYIAMREKSPETMGRAAATHSGDGEAVILGDDR
eukprot:1759799-Pleurochrysis_carterae.AAC.1